jgi:hypothetical protein
VTSSPRRLFCGLCEVFWSGTRNAAYKAGSFRKTTPGARLKLGVSTITRVDLTPRWASSHPAPLFSGPHGTAAHELGLLTRGWIKNRGPSFAAPAISGAGQSIGSINDGNFNFVEQPAINQLQPHGRKRWRFRSSSPIRASGDCTRGRRRTA